MAKIQSDTVETIYNANGNHEVYLKKILKNQQEFMKSTGKSSKKLNIFDKTLSKIVKTALKMSAALFTIAAAKKALQLGELGAQAETVNKNFEKFALDGGRDALDMMKKLKAASGGMIDDMALQQQAMKAMISGVDFDTVVTSLEYVRRFSIATGKDVTQMFNTVMTGMARGSAMFLDDVGIQVMGSKDVVNDAVEQMRQKMGNFADTTGDTSTKIAELKTEFSNLKTEIGKRLIPFMDELTEATSIAVRMMTNFVMLFDVDGNKAAAAMDEMERRATVLRHSLGKANPIIDKQREAIKLLKEEFSKGTVSTEDYNLKLEGMENRLERDTEAVKKFRKELDVLEKEMGQKGFKRKRTVTEDSAGGETDEERKKRLEKQKAAEEKAKNERIKILRELTIARLNEEERAVFLSEEKWKEFANNSKLSEDELSQVRFQMAKESYDIRKGFRDKEAEEEREKYEREIEEAKRVSEEKLDIAKKESEERKRIEEEKRTAISNLVSQSVGFIDSVIRASNRKNMDLLRSDTMQQIEAVKATTKSEKQKAKEIEKIREQSAKKENELRLKQWRADLVMSIAKTALGVANALSSAVPPINFFNAAAVGVAGAAASATIAGNKPRFRTGSVDASGQPRKIPRSFGGSGGVDSEIGLFTPGELIIPPGEKQNIALAAMNGDKQVSQPISISAPITIQGNADERTISMIPRMIEEGVARVLENSGNTNIINPYLV